VGVNGVCVELMVRTRSFCEVPPIPGHGCLERQVTLPFAGTANMPSHAPESFRDVWISRLGSSGESGASGHVTLRLPDWWKRIDQIVHGHPEDAEFCNSDRVCWNPSCSPCAEFTNLSRSTNCFCTVGGKEASLLVAVRLVLSRC